MPARARDRCSVRRAAHRSRRSRLCRWTDRRIRGCGRTGDHRGRGVGGPRGGAAQLGARRARRARSGGRIRGPRQRCARRTVPRRHAPSTMAGAPRGRGGPWRVRARRGGVARLHDRRVGVGGRRGGPPRASACRSEARLSHLAGDEGGARPHRPRRRRDPLLAGARATGGRIDTLFRRATRRSCARCSSPTSARSTRPCATVLPPPGSCTCCPFRDCTWRSSRWRWSCSAARCGCDPADGVDRDARDLGRCTSRSSASRRRPCARAMMLGVAPSAACGSDRRRRGPRSRSARARRSSMPRTVVDLGYQLSVLGMAALIAGGALAGSMHSRDVARWRAARVARTLVSRRRGTVVSAPLVAWAFGRISLVAPVTNILADAGDRECCSPRSFSRCCVAGARGSACCRATRAHPLLRALDVVATVRRRGAHGARSRCAHAATALLAGVARACAPRRVREPRSPRAALVAAGALALAAWSPARDPRARARWSCTSSTSARATPSRCARRAGRWILFDAGRDWTGGDAGRATVVPYLRRRGGDVVAVRPVASARRPRRAVPRAVFAALHPGAYLGCGASPARARRIARRSSRRVRVGVAWQRVHPGDSLAVDGVRRHVLAPDSAWTAGLARPELASKRARGASTGRCASCSPAMRRRRRRSGCSRASGGAARPTCSRWGITAAARARTRGIPRRGASRASRSVARRRAQCIRPSRRRACCARSPPRCGGAADRSRGVHRDPNGRAHAGGGGAGDRWRVAPGPTP